MLFNPYNPKGLSTKGGNTMKYCIIVVALALISTPALAGSWNSYNYDTGETVTGSDNSYYSYGTRSTTGSSYNIDTGEITTYNFTTDSNGYTTGSSYNIDRGEITTYSGYDY